MCACLALAFVAWSPASASTTADPIEFWLIEPNEGDSAGGHAAIRIGESVFHVQRRPDGLLTDWRTPRARFEEVYRGLGNRGIEAIPLDLDDTQRARLRQALEQRFHERRRTLGGLDALDREAASLESAASTGRVLVEVPGSGLIDSKSPGCHDPRAKHLMRFNQTVAKREGEPWLRERLTRAERDVERLTLQMLSSGKTLVLPELVEASKTRAALEMVINCRGVAERHLELVPDHPPLDAASRERLRGAADSLETRMHALLTSRRDDAGLALMLTAARWWAIEHTLATDRLVILDPFAEAPLPSRELGGGLPESWLSRLDLQSRERLARRIADFERDTTPLEARLVALEAELHRARHLRERTLHATPTSWLGGTTPAHDRYVSRRVELPLPLTVPLDEIERRLDRIQTLARDTRRSLENELRYSVWMRNCATELTLLLDLDDHASWDALDFVPIVAAHRVEKALAAGPSRTLPSARRRKIAVLSSSDGGALAGWREWTTLTSPTYRPNPTDSAFLFFTRERFWSRPLLGAGNLVYGTGGTLMGLVSAPFDRGVLLRRGAEGIVMSVPELFFFSIRQGSYPISPPGSLEGSQRSQAGWPPTMR